MRKTTYSSTHSPVVTTNSIPWDQIFSEIEAKLKNQSKYSWTVERGDKCIKVRGAFNADVIPAVQVYHDHLTDPIVIYSFNDQVEKINYPRVHHDNGVLKNKSTGEKYKPTVRMLKNWARNHFNDDKIISSFKIQALLYNLTDDNFADDPAAAFIITGAAIVGMLSPGGQTSIMSVCGSEDILTNWDPFNRNLFIQKLAGSVDKAVTAYHAHDPNVAENEWKTAFNL